MNKKPYVAPEIIIVQQPQTLTDEELYEIFIEQFGGLN